jgi:hypothetical protein
VPDTYIKVTNKYLLLSSLPLQLEKKDLDFPYFLECTYLYTTSPIFIRAKYSAVNGLITITLKPENKNFNNLLNFDIFIMLESLGYNPYHNLNL